jgi:tetratricopeptide (TPR) repeat protein
LILLVTALSGCASLARNRTDQGVVSARQLSLRGINAAQQGQLRDAEAYFSRASELCPLDERIRYHYAETLWQLGSHQEAVTHMEEAVRLSGGNADLVVRLGDMYLASGDLPRAAQQADAAIRANRQSAAAWALRGDVLRGMGNDDEALASYHRAMSYQAHYPRVQLATAEIYGRQKRYVRALATLRTLADGYPSGETPQQVLMMQGLALRGLGRYEAAAEAMTLAAKQGPPSTEMLACLAETQWLAGDAANARLTLQSALSQSTQEQVPEPLTSQLLSLQQKLTGDMRL